MAQFYNDSGLRVDPDSYFLRGDDCPRVETSAMSFSTAFLAHFGYKYPSSPPPSLYLSLCVWCVCFFVMHSFFFF